MSATTEEKRNNPKGISGLLVIGFASLTLLTNIKESLGGLRLLSSLLKNWQEFYGEIWQRLFAWLEPHTVRTIPSDYFDILTLAVSLAGPVGLARLLLFWRQNESPRTVIDWVERNVSSGPIASFILAQLIILAAFAFMILPFTNQIASIFGEWIALQRSLISQREPWEILWLPPSLYSKYLPHASGAILFVSVSWLLLLRYNFDRSTVFGKLFSSAGLIFVGISTTLVVVAFLFLPSIPSFIVLHPASVCLCVLLFSVIVIVLRTASPIVAVSLFSAFCIFLDAIASFLIDVWKATIS